MKLILRLSAILTLVAVGSTFFAHGQDGGNTEARAQEAAEKIINAHIAWKTKLSSSGASLQAKEIDRQGSHVRYRLYVSGLPSGQLYTVLSWPVNQETPSPVIEGASLGEGGIVMCGGRTPEQCGDASQKDDPIAFTFDAAKGEPYRLALIAGEQKVAIVIVPDPILDKNKSCTLSVERLLPHFELAYFSGTGFPPNTEISFDGGSYSEEHTMKAKSDGEGNLQFAMMPAVFGHSNGTTTIKAVGADCAPSLRFDWGR
jgi:hypothetical protein